MCPPSLSDLSTRPHRPRWRRWRRCLLKGCGQWFQPSHPSCRYCSLPCVAEAERWRDWRSQHKYRASGNGRQHRQQQARRYRQRYPKRRRPACRPPPVAAAPRQLVELRQIVSRPAGLPPPIAAAPAEPSCAAALVCGGVSACEGKRSLEKSAAVAFCPCDRPGCYDRIPAPASHSWRRFCCVLCRKALRCVLDREARWRRRRRRGLQPPGRRRRRQARGP